MTRHLATIGAVLRKDVLLSWPIAIPAMILPVLRLYSNAVQERMPLLPLPIEFFAALLSGFLIMAVIHNDAPAGMRQDILIRPVPGRDLLIAKALFLFVTVILPWVASQVVWLYFDRHYPLAEALTSGFFLLSLTLLLIPLLALFAVTATWLDTLLGVGFLVGVSIAATMWQSKQPGNTVIDLGGQVWVHVAYMTVLFLAVSAVVLWLQFGRRRTLPARLVVVGFVLFLASNLFNIPGGVASAAQRLTSTDPAAADPLKIAHADTCMIEADLPPPMKMVFDSFEADEKRRQAFAVTWGAGSINWSEATIRHAGAKPRILRATLQLDGIPTGWKAHIDRLEVRYRDAAGHVQVKPYAGVLYSRSGEFQLPPSMIRSTWLLPTTAVEPVRQGGQTLTVDAEITLMRPIKTYTFPADGTRRYVKGFGYCGVEPGNDHGPKTSRVNCQHAGNQPDQVTARYLDRPPVCNINCATPSYAPLLFDFPYVNRPGMSLPRAQAGQVVELTVWDAVAHVRRQLQSVTKPRACVPLATLPAAPTDTEVHTKGIQIGTPARQP